MPAIINKPKLSELQYISTLGFRQLYHNHSNNYYKVKILNVINKPKLSKLQYLSTLGFNQLYHNHSNNYYQVKILNVIALALYVVGGILTILSQKTKIGHL